MKARVTCCYYFYLALVFFFFHSCQSKPSRASPRQPKSTDNTFCTEDDKACKDEYQRTQHEHEALLETARKAIRWEGNEPTSVLNRSISYGIIGIAEHQQAYSIYKHEDEPAPYYLPFCYNPDKSYPWHVLSVTNKSSGRPFEPIRWQSYGKTWVHPLAIVMKPHTMLFYHCLYGNQTILNIVVDGLVSCRYNEDAMFPLNHLEVIDALPHIYTCWPLIQKVMKGHRRSQTERERDEL